jgi:hypothetical protein
MQVYMELDSTEPEHLNIYHCAPHNDGQICNRKICFSLVYFEGLPFLQTNLLFLKIIGSV